MHSVLVTQGPGHVVVYQSAIQVLLTGLIVGLPLREALCYEGHFAPLLGLIDEVFATGLSLRVDVVGGVLWVMRLEDESGVGLYYDRQPSRPLGASPVAQTQLVSA